MESFIHKLYGTILSHPTLTPHLERWFFLFEDDATHMQIQASVPQATLSHELTPTTNLAGIHAFLLETTVVEAIHHARMIILEPTFLMDVSALSSCVRTYGTSYLNHIFDRLQPTQSSLPIMLGNVANFFLDELLHETIPGELTYSDAIRSYFRRNALEISIAMRAATPEEERNFFTECQRQFNNLRHCITHQLAHPSVQVRREELLIEPSFFAPHLGLQGRLDALTNDYKTIFELKSGKAKEYAGKITHQEPHYFQMLLYYLILRYLPRHEGSYVKAYLLYSRYPLLMPEIPSDDEAFRLLALRNTIVMHDRIVSQAETSEPILHLFSTLTPEMFNLKNEKGTLWNKYQRPQLEERILRIQQLSEIELLYIAQTYSFITRELRAARQPLVNTNGITHTYNRWQASAADRSQQGALLQGLRLASLLNEQLIPEQTPRQVGGLLFILPINNAEQASFRAGDMAFIYPSSSDELGAVSGEVMRGQITSITRHELRFALHAAQRHSSQFVVTEREYCLEPDQSESNLNALYRGIAAFSESSAERRSLLLNGPQGEPELNPPTDTSIKNTVNRAIHTPDMFLLIGPPGSGKTNIALREMIIKLLAQEKNILLLSYTNRAVDEICSMLDTLPQLSYLRIGRAANCDKRYHCRLFEQQAANALRRSDCLAIIDSNPVVVGTVSTLSSRIDLLRLKRFHMAIIDEATQIVETQLLPLLTATENNTPLIPRFILIGDHRQLPAVVSQSEVESRVTDKRLLAIELTDMRQSLFERLYRLITTRGLFSRLGVMTTQGRMHPSIAAFPCREFYNGFLRPLGLPHQKSTLFFHLHGSGLQSIISQHRLLMLATTSIPLNGNPKTNVAEAERVAEAITALIALYSTNNKPFSPSESIGIITPYRSQVALIRRTIEERINPSMAESITIDTVERYQGSQREIIIYSFCINETYQLELLNNETTIDGQTIDRKLNVALTRAREHIILIGNTAILKHSPILKKLIEEAQHEPTLKA